MLFLIILAAGVASAAAGFGLWWATTILPTWDDPAGRGLGDVFRLFFAAAAVLIAMIAFGISAPGRDREPVLNKTMKILLAVPVALIVIGVVINGGARFRFARDAVAAVQILLPIWGVVAVQWLVVRWYIRRRQATPAGEGGAMRPRA